MTHTQRLASMCFMEQIPALRALLPLGRHRKAPSGTGFWERWLSPALSVALLLLPCLLLPLPAGPKETGSEGEGNLLSPEILLHLQQMHLYRGSGWQRALPALPSTPGSTPGISLRRLGHAQRLGFGSGRQRYTFGEGEVDSACTLA